MLVDLHCHTYPISRCSAVDYRQMIAHSKAVGLDGIVIANHYQKGYLKDLNVTAQEFAKLYVEEFEKTLSYAKEVDFKVFFAVEITAEAFPLAHLVVYGVPYEFLYENPEIYDLSLKEIYEKVKQYGGILIQAHPFRSDMTVMNTDFLDGVEINCHPVFGPTCKQELIKISKEKGLHITCGSDYHGKIYRPRCGMIIPDDTENTFDLANYIMSENEKTLLVHEQGEKEAEYIKIPR